MTAISILALSQALGFTRHHFSFSPKEPSNSVSVAGTFNGWNKDANLMKLESDGKTWSLDIDLKYGRYQYKFVRNGSEWIPDPKAEKNEDDGGGNINSHLTILPPDFINTAKRGDGLIAESALEHTTSLPYFNLDGDTITLKLRTRKGDVQSVTAVVNGKSIAAESDYSDEIYEYYVAAFDWNHKSDLTYQFELKDGPTMKRLSYSAKAVDIREFKVPAWVQSSVIYQIFPDRFDNGDHTNDPKDLMPWDAKPTYYNRFGGDIAGVEKHLNYLHDLGISTVYFTPIFKSPSNHRYEADDYVMVDPEFGTNAEFKRLTKDLKAIGINTVLDFAFNHTSVRTREFADIAKNGDKSEFKNWYFPKKYPVVPGEAATYEAWYGFGSMPKLNTTNPATTHYLLDVCHYWLNDVGVNGMRLDVANEVDSNFWRKMRSNVKSLNQDNWIVGEIWGDGNPWLQGDQFDSVMNYQFRDAALRFVAKGTDTASQFAQNLVRVDKSYASQVSRNMMNLLSSHDTPRFITECGGDKDLAKLGAAIQFTWIGEPSVYYGEEIGMQGGKDPGNRCGMEWANTTPNNEMLTYYKKLIKLRRQTQAFAVGKAEFLFADKQSGVFDRVGNDDAAVIFFNRSNQTKQFEIRVPKAVAKLANRGLFDAFTGTRYLAPERPLKVTVAPKSASILVTKPISNSSLSRRTGLLETRNGRGSVQSRANLTHRSPINK
jgi:glycosidase